MKIQNFNLTIVINDVILSGNSNEGIGFQELSITESLGFSLPICKLSFIADDFFLRECPLADGSKIGIELRNEDLKIDEKYIFRLFNLSIKPIANTIIYEILGYYDIYEMYRSPNKYITKADSSQIFINVAKDLRLEYDIDNTSDTQLWSNSELNLAKWLTNITNHGWRNETSCMVWALTRTKTLLYKDISSLLKRANPSELPNLYPMNASFGNINPESKIIPYKMATPVFTSGEENITKGGYGKDNLYFSFEDYDNKYVSAKKAVASSNFVNINKELSKGLEDNFYPIDVGNMHKNYHLASMQNSRISSLFSTYFNVTLNTWYPLQLFNLLNLNYVSDTQANEIIKSLSGIYIINTIVTSITPSTVTQFLTIAGQGYNTSKETGTY